MSIWNRGNWMQTISYTGMGKLRNWTGHNKTLQIVSKEGQMKEDVLPEPGDWDQTTTIRLCWTWRHKGGRAHSQKLPWRPRRWKKNVLIHLFLLLPNPSSAKGSGRQLTQQPGQQDLQGSDAHLHSGAGWGKGEKGTPRANVPSQTPEDSVSSWLLKVQPSFRPRSQTVQVSFPFPLSSHRTFLSWDPDCQKCRWGRSVIRLWHTHPLPSPSFFKAQPIWCFGVGRRRENWTSISLLSWPRLSSFLDWLLLLLWLIVATDTFSVQAF